MSIGIIHLGADEATERQWNFRDDINRHYFGTIPLDQAVITLALSWKATAGGISQPVGRYRLNLPVLERDGYIRRSERGWIVRFQRTGGRIELAVNRHSEALMVGAIWSNHRSG
jgi:hypothetical protein